MARTVLQMARTVPQLTVEARFYALRELCRRAALEEPDLARRWRIEHDPASRVFRLRRESSSAGQVLFPCFDCELNAELTVRKKWLRPAPESLRELVPDFVVPYARSASASAEPLFVESAPGMFRCTEDLLASTALVLSRFEEIEASSRDVHGRFPASDSMAVREGYLGRPIIDEYGLALQQILESVDPGFTPRPRTLRVKVSHDIDEIGIPLSFRQSAVQIVARRRVATGVTDLLSFTGIVPGSLRQVIEICRLCAERNLHSTIYWKASSRRRRYDSGYDIAEPRIARVMNWARSHNLEMGVHPGYRTFLAPDELRSEVERCRSALGASRIGGRQHYLRWRPETWLHWESCGLAYDSTVGYADRVGFRAGTCWPYIPWLWKENRPAELLEIPLIVMDRTLVNKGYMGKSLEESLTLFNDLKRRCAAVGGVMTLLWHNTCLGHPWSAYLDAFLESLASSQNYDWAADLAQMQQRSAAIAG